MGTKAVENLDDSPFVRRCRLIELERRKKLTIEAPVTRKQARCLLLSVGANEKVGQDPGSSSTLLTVESPDSACQEMRIAR